MHENIRILHLEDEPSDALLVSHALKKSEVFFDCLVVDTKDEFLEALKVFKPHIILADHSLPSFNSFEALELVAGLKEKVPVILVTAAMSDEFAVNAIQRGAKDYVLKDRLNRLPSSVLNVLKTQRLEKERADYLVELTRNERKFRGLIENGADAVVVLQSDGSPIYITPSIKRVLGYTENEALQLNVFDIVHEEHRANALRKLKECLAKPQGSYDGYSIRARHKDGGWRWLDLTLSCYMEDSEIEGIVIVFRDVTQRKLSEKALKESEEKYRSFFESSLDGILLTAPQGRILAANTAACQMLQRSEKEICEVGRAGIVDIRDPRVSYFLNDRNKKGKVRAEINLLRKDGSVFPVELSSSIFEDANGVKLNSTIIRDVSKAKLAIEDLKTSENEYRKLFQNSPLPNIIYDEDTKEILDVNTAALDHFGFTRNEILQVNLLDFVPPDEISAFRNNISNLQSKDRDVSYSGSINLIKKGQRIRVETYGYGLPYKGKKCRLIIFLDITEKEEALQKLKYRTEKLLTAQKIAKLGYWTHNLENNNFFWSEEVYKIWERDPTTFHPNIRSFRETFHPDDLEKFEEANEAAMKNGEEMDFEHRIILPNGEIKWVHEKGKLISSGDSKIVFEGTVQDITERRNSLEKLMQSEARQRGILKSQTNYLTRIDMSGNYSYVNEKFNADFKWIYPNGIIVAQPALSSVKEYHRAKVFSVFENCVANPNVVFQVELEKLREDGGERSTLWDFICLPDANGNPIEVQGVGVDITDRVKAEEALKESNLRYELVSKATSDAIYDWDIGSNVLLYGEAFYAMTGYTPEKFSSGIETFLDNIHPDDKQSVRESLIYGIDGSDNHWEAEFRFKKADGKYASVLEKGFILRDNENKAFRMVGAMQDVTEKKKLEELLDEASRFAQIGSFDIDCEADTMYWSPVTKQIHEVGMDYDPNLKKGILFYKKGESRKAMLTAYLKALKENIPYDLELQIITAKGQERWVRKIGRPTFINGKCVRINGSFQNITNIKKSELEAIKASEEKEIILESIGDAFFMVDNDWTVTYWNQHSEKLLDCPKNMILGKNLWEIFPDAIGTKFYSSYKNAVAYQTVENFEEFFIRSNKWLEVTAYPSKSGLSVYFRDVTERKESELQIIELNNNLKAHTKELVEANKGLEQFSFIVSHNLRSPVANILGLADLIGNKDYEEEIKNNFLEALLDNVKRLDLVISDLNSILQVKVEIDAKKENVLLNDLVDAIKTSIYNLIEKEQVQITTHFEAPVFHSVQSYLHSIFYNLIANSIKYRRAGITPKINISSNINEGGLVIIFEDNGLGIDLNKRGDQVFGLYRRFHHHVEGKGMGLFLVKTQVELLGGKIAVESEVNKGTKFTITFKEKIINYISENEETAIYGSR